MGWDLRLKNEVGARRRWAFGVVLFLGTLRPCRVFNFAWLSEGPFWVQGGRRTREKQQDAGKSGRRLWKDAEEGS